MSNLPAAGAKTGGYVPPSIRNRAAGDTGDSMNKRREENSVRVTNLSEDTREDDLRVRAACWMMAELHKSTACRVLTALHAAHIPVFLISLYSQARDISVGTVISSVINRYERHSKLLTPCNQ